MADTPRRLMVDHTDGAYAVTVSCYGCGRRVKLADCWADLDGAAFEAYYCLTCIRPAVVAGARIAEPCRRPGCTRCGPHAYLGPDPSPNLIEQE